MTPGENRALFLDTNMNKSEICEVEMQSNAL